MPASLKYYMDAYNRAELSNCVYGMVVTFFAMMCRKVNKEVEGGKQKGSGGIWGYIAGTPAT